MAIEVQERPGAARDAGENPLVPHAKLRSIFLGMRDGRLLEREINAGRRRGHRSETPYTEEACRASTLLSLENGDLICGAAQTPAMELLLETAPAAILSRRRQATSASSMLAASPNWLTVEAGDDRLRLALGAAMALKSQANGRSVLVYVQPAESRLGVWRSVLELAASASLPMLFVILPATPGAKPSGLSIVSEKIGVPGIAVDAHDCVAIFRVANEALVRARTGGGPVLLEAITAFPGAPKQSAADPVTLLRQSLLARGVVTPTWLRDTETAFLKQLKPPSSAKANSPRKRASSSR